MFHTENEISNPINMIPKTHYLRNDYRAESIKIIIKGLENAIEVLKKRVEKEDYYDIDFFMEDSEPIYGLAFIAFQNYINGSIKDFMGSLEKKHELYKFGKESNKYSKSKIELIITLANYSKHKDEGKPYKATRETLDSFELTYENITYLDKSPIFQGLTILNEDWNLFQITEIVTEWRELLWNTEIEFNF